MEATQGALTDGTANDQVPNWTRRGDRLLLFSDRTGKNQLHTMRPDGGDVRSLVRTAFNDRTGFWSPDNRRISFVSDRDGNPELYTMDAQGRAVIRLTHTPAIERSAVWSPDDRRLAYTVEDDDHSEIYLMNADGTGTHKLIPWHLHLSQLQQFRLSFALQRQAAARCRTARAPEAAHEWAAFAT